MLSVETSDVSIAPGREVWIHWNTKLAVFGFQKNSRSAHRYCAPTVELRSAQVGFSGSAGGCVGLGPTWQKPHDMPTRYGFTSLGFG